MNLRTMALKRKVKRLKNDLSGAKQIINTLNLRLSDAEEETAKIMIEETLFNLPYEVVVEFHKQVIL